MAKITHRDSLYPQLFPQVMRKGERTKYRLVEAAIEILGKDGYGKFTFESVGVRVKMNRSQVRYHFPSTNSLLEKVFELVIHVAQEHLNDYLKQFTQWDKLIVGISDGFFDWGVKLPTHARCLLLFYYMASTDKRFRELHTRMGEDGNNRVLAALSEAPMFKKWTAREREDVSQAIWAVIDGFIVYMLASEVKKDPARYQKHARAAVKRLLGLPQK